MGSGCARCLAPFVKRVMLCARNAERLRTLAAELEADGMSVEIATRLEQVPFAADLVICAASLASPSLRLGRIAPQRHHLRRGLSEKLESWRRYAGRPGLQWRSWDRLRAD